MRCHAGDSSGSIPCTSNYRSTVRRNPGAMYRIVALLGVLDWTSTSCPRSERRSCLGTGTSGLESSHHAGRRALHKQKKRKKRCQVRHTALVCQDCFGAGEMPRRERVFVEGGVYHVYNRVGRGEQVFDLEDEAVAFVSLLCEVTRRDGLTVFAWCLMSNHYHLAVRTGVVPLDRPMRSLQQRVTRGVNQRRRVYGPLWQGRYRAKMVEDQRYLDQLLAYIHLNPRLAGMVDDPAEHLWGGHREILGKVKEPIVDVDEVISVRGLILGLPSIEYQRGQRKGA